MSTVQPIREKKKVREIDTYLRGKSDRDHILWLIGIQTGLRVSDIVKLRAGDITESIREKKTKKQRPLYHTGLQKSAGDGAPAPPSVHLRLRREKMYS